MVVTLPWTQVRCVIWVWCTAVLCTLGATASAADDTLYGALILATNVEHAGPPPEELHNQVANLQAVFGYNEFRVLGRKRASVVKGAQDWLVSSKQFFLRVDTKNAVPSGYALGLELRKEDRVIIQADVTLSRERPLFIRGPFVAQGQLIILLMIL